jgi:uncharacterized membrane protein
MAWQGFWHALLPQPAGNTSARLALILLIPLVLPLWGVIKGVHRTMVLAGFLLLLYFVGGITEAWSTPPQRWPALVQTFLCAGYFTALVLWSRQLRRAAL